MRMKYFLLISLILAVAWLAATAQDSTQTADSTKTENKATDTTKADSAKADTAKAAPKDTAKTDTAKAAPAKQETAEADTTKQAPGMTRLDSIRAAAARQQAEKQQSAKADSSKQQSKPVQSPLVDSLRRAKAEQDSIRADSIKAAQGEAPADTTADTTAVMKPEEKPAHAFVGAKKCKICHKDEYTSWMVTAHARTFERLGTEDQVNDKCLPCHTTGTTINNVLLEGVQCEACHGAGNDYRKTKIMKDKDAAKEAGLIDPDKEVCERCHNEDSPTFKGFDFDTAIQKLEEIHIIKSAEKE